MSTVSPGKMKPEAPLVAVTGTEMARIPGRMTAARNPRLPGATIFDSVIGSPAAIGGRATQPENDSGERVPITMYALSRPPSGQGCQIMSSGLMIWPRGMPARASENHLAGAARALGAAPAV